jgi:hypothetical protein
MSLAVSKALRENAGLLGVVQKDMQNAPAGVGETVTVGFAAPLEADDVSPAATITLPSDIALKQKQVSLSAWKKAEFYLTSRDEAKLADAQGSWVPEQLAEAVRAVLVPVRTALYLACKKFNGYAGTSQETFVNSTDKLANYAAARKTLNQMLCPRVGRVAMLGADEEAAALNIEQFIDASKTGDQSNPAFRDGIIGRVLGFETHGEDANDIPALHTAGNATGWVLDGEHAIGSTTIDVKSGSGDLHVGSIVTIGNFTYSVLTDINTGSFTINEPGLRETVTDGTAVTLKDSHTICGYGFVPSGIMLVGRMPMQKGALGVHQAVTDPVTGLMLKLSVLPGDECVLWRVSSLYGADVIDPRKGCRFALESQSSS